MSGEHDGGPGGARPRSNGGPLDRLGLNEEAKVFARMAAFGLLVGAGYGVLTGEPAGIVMLLAFGLASAIALIAIVIGSRRDHRPQAPRVAAESAPGPGWAPLEVGLGLGGLALGAAFGPWLAIAGLLVALIGAKGWLDAATGEADAIGGDGDPGEPERDA